MYTHYTTGVMLTIHKAKRFTRLKYKCPRLLCPCSRCVQRGHKMHETSSKQCRPTLSMTFTTNRQDLTRYSTMDKWPSWAAQCKAVYPASLESKRWPSILGSIYTGTQQQQDGHPQHTRGRHCFLPAMNNRNRQITTRAHMHAKEIDNTVYPLILCPSIFLSSGETVQIFF